MLRPLVEASLRRPGVVIALGVLAAGYGVAAVASSRLEVLPECAPPRVVVHTAAPGFSPEEVEALVTRPVEESLHGIEDLEAIRSRSTQGLSLVTAAFREGAGVLDARRRVAERLARIGKDLPAGTGMPVMAPLASRATPVLGLGLTAEKRSLMDLRTLADGTIRPRLLGVPGIASVAAFGGEVRQIQVQYRPEALARHQMPLSRVVEAARQATGSLGAGFIETANQRIPVVNGGQAVTAEEIGEMLAAPGIRLKDVARVVDAPAPRTGDAAIDGEPGVILLAWGQHERDTLELTRSLEAALEEMRPELEREGIRLHADLFRPASFLKASIRNAAFCLAAGAFLAALVLALAFRSVRVALIAFLAIAVALPAAALLLPAAGATLNALTWGGLAAAAGMVIGDAVLDVELARRRLRENRGAGSPRPAFAVVLDSSLEARRAAVPATLAAALAFLPALALPGVQGKLFAPLAAGCLLGLLVSLILGLTLTPALCLFLLARTPAAEEPAAVRRLKSLEDRLLAAAAARPGRALAGALLVAALAALALPFLGGRLLPRFRDGRLIIEMSMAPGTSALESMRLGRQVSKDLFDHLQVRSVSLRIGRAELGVDGAGPESGEIVVSLQPSENEERARAEAQRLLAAVPGARFAVKSFLEEALDEALAGARSEVTIRLHGEDRDVLDGLAAEAARVLAAIPGSAGVRFQEWREPRLSVRPRRDKLQYLGFRSGEVLETVRTSFQGTRVAQVHDGNRVIDVVVILDEAHRQDPEGVGSLMVENAAGTWAPLREVADVFLATGRHAVMRDGSRRCQEVSARVEGRELGAFVREAKAKVESQVRFPAAVRPVFVAGAGAAPGPARFAPSMLAAAALALLLATALKRPARLLLVLAGLPFALAGGALALLVTGCGLSLGSLVGFAILFALTTRNSVLSLSRFERLIAEEGRPWSLDTARRGAAEGLVPVLASAAATALYLLPLAIARAGPGAEIAGPMAIVVLGGLVTSTALDLLVLPVLAMRDGRLGA